MEKLVRLDDARDAGQLLERVAGRDIDGIELDLTGMSEEEYLLVKERFAGTVPVTSIHYGNTRDVSLGDWDAFAVQLDMLVGRAGELGAGAISIDPPLIGREEARTVKDLQAFMERVGDYAERSDVDICFSIGGFLRDPQLINDGIAPLEGSAVGVMLDLADIAAGAEAELLRRLDVDVHKIRVPVGPDHIENLSLDMRGAALVARLE